MSYPPAHGRRIAFFGGSFDPPHCGHIAIARAARQALALDSILFAPVALQPLKPNGSSASFEDRVAMTKLAIATEPQCELSLIDALPTAASTPNYTAETLVRLRETLSPQTELYLLLGADSFRTLPHWHRAAEIPFLAGLIVASRPGEHLDEDAAALASVLPPSITAHSTTLPNRYSLTAPDGRQATLTILPNLHYDISATQLREAIRTHTATNAEIIPQIVLSYIREHHLYQ